MLSEKVRLYLLVLICSLAGYIWLYFNILDNPANSNIGNVCLIKAATNIPCPSCGSTRSVIFIIEGNFKSALYANPFGFIIAFIMVCSPFWIFLDIITGRSSYYQYFQKFESVLRKPKISIILILIVLSNWAWAIMKGL